MFKRDLENDPRGRSGDVIGDEDRWEDPNKEEEFEVEERYEDHSNMRSPNPLETAPEIPSSPHEREREVPSTPTATIREVPVTPHASVREVPATPPETPPEISSTPHKTVREHFSNHHASAQTRVESSVPHPFVRIRSKDSQVVPGNDYRPQKATLYRVYRNNDKLFKGLQVSYSRQQFPLIESFTTWLNEKISTPTGVRHLFSWPSGMEIKSNDDLDKQESRILVVSSMKNINKDIDYGDALAHPENAETVHARKNHHQAETTPEEPEINSETDRFFTITSNLKRRSHGVFVLNPESRDTFADLMRDIITRLDIPRPPIKSLHYDKPPYTKVLSLHQLFRDFQNGDGFLACGEEVTPRELTQIK